MAMVRSACALARCPSEVEPCLLACELFPTLTESPPLAVASKPMAVLFLAELRALNPRAVLLPPWLLALNLIAVGLIPTALD